MSDFDETVSVIKEHVQTVCSLLETVDEGSGACRAFDIDGRISDLFPHEIQMFWLYLTASDGVISDDEVDLLNSVFDMSLSSAEYRQIIIDCDIYSHEFEERPPISLYIAAYGEEFYKTHTGETIDISEIVINSYEAVGEALIKSDGNIDASELADLNIYIGMLRQSVSVVKQTVKNRFF